VIKIIKNMVLNCLKHITFLLLSKHFGCIDVFGGTSGVRVAMATSMGNIYRPQLIPE
jgi:hypothetical protein